VRLRTWIVALTSFAALLGAAGPGFSAGVPARSHASLRGSFVPGQALVRFRSGTSGSAAARVNAGIGARTLKRFTSPAGLQLVRLPAGVAVDSAVARYGQHPEVLYAERNQIYSVAGTDETLPNDPDFNLQWNWRQASDHDVDATNAWDLTTGSRTVIVGLIDTGVQTQPHLHPDLRANIWSNTLECTGQPGMDDDANGYVDDCHGIDTINGDSDPNDDFNHGTHVAGIMGAVGNNGVGVTGINWRVKVLPCKSHDNTGLATEASVLECLAYIKAIKDRGETVVATNNSYGGCTEACGFSQAFRDAIKDQMNDGILFVAAAGNSSLNHDTDPSYPSSYYLPNVISAASTTSSDSLSFFSDYGLETVEVGAPGDPVYSTKFTDTYGYESGTSMASPHVAGLAALLKANDPSLDWRAIRNLIIAGGDKTSSLSGKTISGRRINADGSLRCSNVGVAAVLRPFPTVPLARQRLAALNIRCANPAGSLRVRITPGGDRIRLRDSGQGQDLAAGDGIYSGAWTPAAGGDYVLHFSNGLTATVHVQ
jgi:subtilisin family serine protease